MQQENERILDLCRKVSTEKDSVKMTQLVRQLNAELDKLAPRKTPEIQSIKPREARRA